MLLGEIDKEAPQCRNNQGENMPASSYSPDWYQLFLDPIPMAHTGDEISFVQRQMPAREFKLILDLCCGSGRHSEVLSDSDYDLIGIDTNAIAIQKARSRGIPDAKFVNLDMRDVSDLDVTFDGVINLWQSFGYFDEHTNREIIQSLAGVVRTHGRLIFDIYNRESLIDLPEEDTSLRNGIEVHTQRKWQGSRLKVDLAYSNGGTDRFEWYVYTPHEFVETCISCGLSHVLSCSWFNEEIRTSAEHARMQLVFEKPDEDQ